MTFDPRRKADQHWHAYATSLYKSQGKTADRAGRLVATQTQEALLTRREDDAQPAPR